MGIVDNIKAIFTEKTVVGLGYATVSGLASAVLGGVLERASNGNKWLGYFGNVLGAGLMSWVADKMGHPEWRGYAVFGALFPPIWEWVSDKISPEQLADKVATNLGLTWSRAAMSAPVAAPVTVTVAPAPAPVETAPAAPVEEEHLF